MFPELFRFELFGHLRVVHSYGVMLLFAVAVGTTLAACLAPRRGLRPWDGASVALLAVACGVLGSGLLDAAVNWRLLFSGEYMPGLVFYGGVLAAVPAVVLFARRFRLPLGALGDIAAVALPVAHALGRGGCLLGGCCHGGASGGWPGIVYADPRAPAWVVSGGHVALHPVPLYEAGGLLLIASLAAFAFLRGWARGRLFLLYAGGYALLRFCTELLRGDTTRGFWGPLSTSQCIAVVALVLVCAVAWRGGVSAKGGGQRPAPH